MEGKKDLTLVELKWSYRCAAHNLLVAVLSKTQEKPKLFESYLFEDVSFIYNIERFYHYKEVFFSHGMPLLIKRSRTNLKSSWKICRSGKNSCSVCNKIGAVVNACPMIINNEPAAPCIFLQVNFWAKAVCDRT